MKHFFIITRDLHKNRTFILRVKKAIEDRGGSCEYTENPEDTRNVRQIQLPENTECIITVGGDGTVVRAAQNTSESRVPLIGVNRGHLGYLCDLDGDTIFKALDALMADQYQIEERMLLQGYIRYADGTVGDISEALNDIVLICQGGIQVIRLTVYINGQYLYSYNCDGMIFATPTGSTAYNLSANGPIVDPKTELILLTPINPHTLNSRSIVLDCDDEVSVEIIPRREGDKPAAQVSFDGNHIQILRPGDRIFVSKAAQKTRMIHLSRMNFLERIRTKLQDE